MSLNEIDKKRGFSRRDFLKLGGLAGVVGLNETLPGKVLTDLGTTVSVTEAISDPDNKELSIQIADTYLNWGIPNPFPVELLAAKSSEAGAVRNPGKVTLHASEEWQTSHLLNALRQATALLGNNVSKYLHDLVFPDASVYSHPEEFMIILHQAGDGTIGDMFGDMFTLVESSKGVDTLNTILQRELNFARILTENDLAPDIGYFTQRSVFHEVGEAIAAEAGMCLDPNNVNDRVLIRKAADRFYIKDYRLVPKDNFSTEDLGLEAIEIHRADPTKISESLLPVMTQALRRALTEMKKGTFYYIFSFADRSLVNLPSKLCRIIKNKTYQEMLADFFSLGGEKKMKFEQILSRYDDKSLEQAPYVVRYSHQSRGIKAF